MKTYTILLLLFFTSRNVRAQKTTHKVQDFILNERNGHWEAKGEPYPAIDTLTLIHGYRWKREQIISVQDYRKQDNKWLPVGEPYATPDTLKLIHAFVK